MANPENKQIPGLDVPMESLDGYTFEQILQMDDDEDCEFSRSIVNGFFDQAQKTIEDMRKALKGKDRDGKDQPKAERLDDLSKAGHFLKGSSATLGLTRIKSSCENIQRLGEVKDKKNLSDEEADSRLQGIKREVAQLQDEYTVVEPEFRKFCPPLQAE